MDKSTKLAMLSVAVISGLFFGTVGWGLAVDPVETIMALFVLFGLGVTVCACVFLMTYIME